MVQFEKGMKRMREAFPTVYTSGRGKGKMKKAMKIRRAGFWCKANEKEGNMGRHSFKRSDVSQLT
ncbi:hypothetical protein RJ639_035505, partial [Escallonia herrerae]